MLACNRATALLLLLRSLNRLQLAGSTVALEIFVDRNKTGALDEQTFAVARDFTFRFGAKRVHVCPHHVGIYGQWLDTWCPSANSSEQALLLEEDLVISPMSWRWLRAVMQVSFEGFLETDQ